MEKVQGDILDAIAESDQKVRVNNQRLVDLVYAGFRRRPTLRRVRRVAGAIEEAISEITSSRGRSG